MIRLHQAKATIKSGSGIPEYFLPVPWRSLKCSLNRCPSSSQWKAGPRRPLSFASDSSLTTFWASLTPRKHPRWCTCTPPCREPLLPLPLRVQGLNYMNVSFVTEWLASDWEFNFEIIPREWHIEIFLCCLPSIAHSHSRTMLFFKNETNQNHWPDIEEVHSFYSQCVPENVIKSNFWKSNGCRC